MVKILLLFAVSFLFSICGFAAGDVKVEGGKTLPKMVELGAKQCVPCKKMAPIIEELTREFVGALDVEFIDVWVKENAEKAKAYNIRSIPSQVFLGSDGKEIWRHEGFISKEDILKKWKELGYEFKASNAEPVKAP